MRMRSSPGQHANPAVFWESSPCYCPACATRLHEFFFSKHPHVCAGAAWLRLTFRRASWRTSTTLQLQLVQQLVLQPASKQAVQMAGSTPGASAAGEKVGCDHAQLCKCCSRDHPPPNGAGKPSQPLTPWPHRAPTISNPGFGKGCSSACSLRLWVGSSVEGAALFNLPEVS